MLLGQVHSPDRIRYTLSPDEIGSGSLSSSAGEFRYTLQCRCDRAGDVLDLLFREMRRRPEWGISEWGGRWQDPALLLITLRGPVDCGDQLIGEYQRIAGGDG